MRTQAEEELGDDEGEVESHPEGEGAIEARRKVVMMPVAPMPAIVRLAELAVRVIMSLVGGMRVGSVCHESLGG
jgi:hypothetical protein